ncbi:MAG: amino acid permease, partial [Patescibacteria group bacterium]
MPKAKFFQGIGLMVGMIFGAGVFVLPFSIAQAGIFWGLVDFAAAFSLAVFLHLWYAQVSYQTKGRHRIIGYARIYFGRKTAFLTFLVTMFSSYGTLLIYGILGGIFLANIFPGINPKLFTFFFFLSGSALILLRLKKIAAINFCLTLPIFGFVIYLLLTGFPFLNFNNFNFFSDNSRWFLPFGVWFFALTGFSVIPETRDLFIRDSLKSFKKVVFLSILITAVFYFIFIFSVLGVSGAKTSPDAISGLAAILGQRAVFFGSFIGLLAVFTSFLALAADLKNIFKYDYKVSDWFSWFLVFLIPLFLFYAGVHAWK